MANQYEYDEDIEDDNSQNQSDAQIPAGLRKALKRLEKENLELKEQQAQALNQLRDRSVKDVLDSKGVPSKIAKFIPSDVATPEQVDAWLTENADIFGFQSTPEPDAIDPQRQEAANKFQRINNATETAIPASNVADLEAQLNNPNLTKADLDAITGVSNNFGNRRRF